MEKANSSGSKPSKAGGAFQPRGGNNGAGGSSGNSSDDPPKIVQKLAWEMAKGVNAPYYERKYLADRWARKFMDGEM